MPDPLSPPRLIDASDVATPALVVDLERLDFNTRRMIELAGSAGRLRPHVKTHKMRQVVARHRAAGIDRFKAATLVEAELAALEGAVDVLVAYPLVGPQPRLLGELVARRPGCRFSALVDSPQSASRLADAGILGKIDLWIDVDSGMGRTGVAPSAVAELSAALVAMGVECVGLHVYDGQIKTKDPAERAREVAAAWQQVEPAVRAFTVAFGRAPRVVAGGAPTFAIHAGLHEVELSPGTCVFWDYGYQVRHGDLGFATAAWLLARVVARPTSDTVTLDLGVKAVASEMNWPRILAVGLEDAELVRHSEEHLTLRSRRSSKFAPGDLVWALPWHVCPSVALYPSAAIVDGGRIVDRWPIAPRY